MNSKSGSSDEAARSVHEISAEVVVLVDADDRSIGTMGKLEAHQRGLLHRAISVVVRDSGNRLLLQQRAPNKYHSGGLWANTCCSHPRLGEAMADAAARRLVEEMGFACSLSFLFPMRYCAPVSNGLVENELVHVFGGQFDGTPDPNPNEVMAWCWKHPTELAKELDEQPAAYTVWFRKYCREHWNVLSGM
jgi:isopentenyl-diphosphate delta-isomerase